VTVKTVAVIGAGTMGHGIAQAFALGGFQVLLVARHAETLDKALQRIRENLLTCLEYGIVEQAEADQVPSRIVCTSDTDEVARKSELIIETVPEDLAVKHELLRRLEQSAAADAVICSNSSSFRVADMAVALKIPKRFLGTHFWNPPHIMPMVEVVRGDQTSDAAIETTMQLLRAIGKHPALVKRDVPGFVGNRLQHALRREAIAIVADGIASPEDVDLIARLSFGLRMPVVGPLQTVDLGGLDLTLAIQSYLLPHLDRSTQPKPMVRDMVARGELGAKSGKGFFDWPTGKQAEVIRKRDRALLDILRVLRGSGLA